jgi:hypothetical protein
MEDFTMKVSERTSMIITAFCFMVLMLIITAPAAGPGVGIDPGPVSEHYFLTGVALVSNPALPVSGPGPDGTPILELLQNRAGK